MKITLLFFLFFICMSPLYTEPNPNEDIFLSEESPHDEEALADDEPPHDEETLAGDEPPRDEETLAGDEPPHDKEILVSSELFPEEEDFIFNAPPLIIEVPVYTMRSFDDIFPSLTRRQRRLALSESGLKFYFEKDESARLIPNQDLEIDLLGTVMGKDPSHFIEALAVVPYKTREFDLLDIYNALGRIERIKNQSVLLNGRDYYIFTESTRIESSENRRAVPDPSPSFLLPFSQTMYLRLREIHFGDLYIRAEISISMLGITYSMTNFTDIRYLFIPVLRAERFITIIYLEPVKEGVLIYSVTGFYLPGFIADRANLTPSINRRIDVFIKWITEGLKIQEDAAIE